MQHTGNKNITHPDYNASIKMIDARTSDDCGFVMEAL